MGGLEGGLKRVFIDGFGGLLLFSSVGCLFVCVS